MIRLLCALLLATEPLIACTGIKLIAEDGSIVHGRTAEFGIDLDLSLLYIPRDYEFVAKNAKGRGLQYKSKYAAIGTIAYGAPGLLDGMNEMGLSVGVFFFPNYAEYVPLTPQNQSKALSPLDFSNWLVTQFATVDEIKEAIDDVVIINSVLKGWGSAPPPFHYLVIDKGGNSLVIEPVAGKLKVHENKLGVITNSPTFDWHMTNLKNYLNLNPVNVKPKVIDGVELAPPGQGSGMMGLPGDFSPPSRFVRAAIFSTTAVPAPNSTKAVFQAFHILNQFDIPFGTVRAVENGVTHIERTQATSVRDPQSLKYYFRTYEDQTIKSVDLNSFDPSSKKLKYISLSDIEYTQRDSKFGR